MTDSDVRPVTMPKWGLSMRSGKITGWLVAEGDAVEPGGELADIDTEKITGTLEADSGGTIGRLIAKAGEDVPVGATIALLTQAEVPGAVLDQLAAQARAVIDAGLPAGEDTGPAVESVTVGGRKVCYAGAGSAGDVVLLVHGFGGDRNSWLFLQEPLAARHRVYALDLPGHGTSGKDVGDGSPGLLADAVLGVLDAVAGPGGGRAHLAGHSLGGAVALAAAARAPERVASLTLFAPAGFGAEINAGYLRGFAAARTRRELKPLLGQLFADPAQVTRQMTDELLAYKRLDGVDAALTTLAEMMLDGDAQRIDSVPALRALGGAVPVTVAWGSADQIIPAAQAAAVTAAAPAADSRVIDGAGHMAHMERPGEAQAAIAAAIARAA
ncbi:MAG TPA: acetoin dehydrogenase dihydrolipoyllysine-residue acetyltransferase subunit [Trebonia sp.]|nr:acetoin dehydrogenase dihydrolipoyllysine-residue acetyltransferase subunit [Trebonia sp.]